MNAIEHLRYLARASGAEVGALGAEAAYALGSVARHKPRELLTASRRLLHAQPAIGPLWWLCARLAVASDPVATAREVADELTHNATIGQFAHALDDNAVVAVPGWPDTALRGLRRRGDAQVLVLDVEGQGFAAVRYLEESDVDASSVDAHQLAGIVSEADVIVLEAAAAGEAALITDVGAYGLAAVAKAQNVPVWVLMPAGRHLPEPYFGEILLRLHNPDTPAWFTAHDVIPYGLLDRVITPGGAMALSELGSSECPLATELLR